MSRMFCTVDSDGRIDEERITVHEEVEIEVRWGSLQKSKKLIHVNIWWQSGTDKPVLKIEYDNSLEDVFITSTESEPKNYRGKR